MRGSTPRPAPSCIEEQWCPAHGQSANMHAGRDLRRGLKAPDRSSNDRVELWNLGTPHVTSPAFAARPAVKRTARPCAGRWPQAAIRSTEKAGVHEGPGPPGPPQRLQPRPLRAGVTVVDDPTSSRWLRHSGWTPPTARDGGRRPLRSRCAAEEPAGLQDGAVSRTTATGQLACRSRCWLTEPSSAPRRAPRPRDPTTSS